MIINKERVHIIITIEFIEKICFDQETNVIHHFENVILESQ